MPKGQGMPKGRGLAAGLLAGWIAVAGGAAASAAEGLPLGGYIRLEGQVGHSVAEAFSSGSVADGPADRGWQDAGSDTLLGWGGRGQIGWDFAAGGLLFRVGLIGNGWTGEQTQDNPVQGFVIFEPTDTKPVGEIRVCDGSPCPDFDHRQRRSYWEVMPDLAIGFEGAAARYWFGLRPFYGAFDQWGESGIGNTPGSGLGAENRTDSRLFGALVTARAELPVSEGLTLAVGLGAGPYRVKAESTTRGRTYGAVIEDSMTRVGLRGQLEVALDAELGGGFSLGLAGRADYWSDQPAVPGYSGDWGGEAPCTRLPNGDLVCEPPRAVGDNRLASESRIDLFVGVGLTLRF